MVKPKIEQNSEMVGLPGAAELPMPLSVATGASTCGLRTPPRVLPLASVAYMKTGETLAITVSKIGRWTRSRLPVMQNRPAKTVSDWLFTVFLDQSPAAQIVRARAVPMIFAEPSNRESRRIQIKLKSATNSKEFAESSEDPENLGEGGLATNLWRCQRHRQTALSEPLNHRRQSTRFCTTGGLSLGSYLQ